MTTSSQIINIQLPTSSTSTNQQIVEDVNLLDGEEILYMNIPTQPKWKMSPLFNKSQKNGIQVWQIGFDPSTSELVVCHGFWITPSGDRGKIQKDRHLVVLNKSNRDIQEQSHLEAKQKYIEMTRKGYKTDINGLSSDGYTDSSGQLLPQLGNRYNPPGSKDPGSGKALTCQIKDGKGKGKNANVNHFESGVVIQTKIDGLRGVARRKAQGDGFEVVIGSRELREFKYLEGLKAELHDFFKFLPDGIALDGELFNVDLSFNMIISAVKSEKSKSMYNDTINYYIFDIMMQYTTLDDRIQILYNAYQCYLDSGHTNTRFQILPQYPASSYDDIDKCLRISIDAGYEGIVIRKLAGKNPDSRQREESWYKSGRNNNLLKYKVFDEEEAIVVAVKEGTGRETGMAIFTLSQKYTPPGGVPQDIVFDCRPRGSTEMRIHWFQHPELCMGKRYTFRFFGRSEYNVPRFPTGKAFRDYE